MKSTAGTRFDSGLSHGIPGMRRFLFRLQVGRELRYPAARVAGKIITRDAAAPCKDNNEVYLFIDVRPASGQKSHMGLHGVQQVICDL
jgi:hypothetical protein